MKNTKEKMMKIITLNADDEEDEKFQSGVTKLQRFGWVTKIDRETLQINREFFEILTESYSDLVSDQHVIERNQHVQSHPRIIEGFDFLDTMGLDIDFFSFATTLARIMLEKIGGLKDPSADAFIAIVTILHKLNEEEKVK